jgi:hypothetical protein
MLVGLVNKKKANQIPTEKPTMTDLKADLPPSKVRFSHLEMKTKEITPLGSPRSIMGMGSDKDIGTFKRTKTPKFMLDKDKNLNKFLTNAKLVNQATHIIDMGDQILYIGIIGKVFSLN